MKNEIEKETRGSVRKDTFRRCRHKHQPAQIEGEWSRAREPSLREGKLTEITQNQTTRVPRLNRQEILPSLPPFPPSFRYPPCPLPLKHLPTTSCSSALLHTIASSHARTMEWKRWVRQHCTRKRGPKADRHRHQVWSVFVGRM